MATFEGTHRTVDLRSDTVTRPTSAMRKAMAEAEVGDDVYGEDPTVTALERRAAEMLGKEAALFVSSGTQGNLLALLSHCQRGDEYIVGHRMHCYRSEAGGAAVLGGIQPQPLEAPRGVPSLEAIETAIKPDDFHYPRTRLVCIENTQSGRVLEQSYIDAVTALAARRGLAVHMDGARIFNASIKSRLRAERITRDVDSVSFCLSKGLGAPVGSVLCGSVELIGRARRTRKLVGGGMRQAGIIAAAGLHALEHHISRLADDHENAARLASGLASRLEGSPGVHIEVADTETNMVFLEVPEMLREPLREALAASGVLISTGSPIRLVTHLDVDRGDIDPTIEAFARFFETHRLQ